MNKPKNRGEFIKQMIGAFFGGGLLFLVGLALSFVIIGIPFVIAGALMMILGVLGLIVSPFVKIENA